MINNLHLCVELLFMLNNFEPVLTSFKIFCSIYNTFTDHFHLVALNTEKLSQEWWLISLTLVNAGHSSGQ